MIVRHVRIFLTITAKKPLVHSDKGLLLFYNFSLGLQTILHSHAGIAASGRHAGHAAGAFFFGLVGDHALRG